MPLITWINLLKLPYPKANKRVFLLMTSRLQFFASRLQFFVALNNESVAAIKAPRVLQFQSPNLKLAKVPVIVASLP